MQSPEIALIILAGFLLGVGSYVARIGYLIIFKGTFGAPEPEQPSCFGEYAFRHPHITAERDCRRCPFLFDCHESSPFLHA